MDLPDLQADEVVSLVKRVYGFDVANQRKLNSTDDINIHVTVTVSSDNPAEPTPATDGYVLKILNSVDSMKVEFVDAMHEAIDCSIRHGIPTSVPVKNKAGKLFSLELYRTCKHEEKYFLVRLFRYVPGEVLFNKLCTPLTCYNLGQAAAKLDKALMTLEHPALFGHKRHWSLTEVVNLEDSVYHVKDAEDQQLLRDVVKAFRHNVAHNYGRLQKGVIHGDLNCGNVLVKRLNDHDANGQDLYICGVLDFGDLVHEYHVFDLAITMMYLMGEETSVDQIEACGHLLAGYLANFRLPSFDLSVLKECVCARLVQSLVYGTWAIKLRLPSSQDDSGDNSPKRIREKWASLRKIWTIEKSELYSRWNNVLKGYEIDLEISSH